MKRNKLLRGFLLTLGCLIAVCGCAKKEIVNTNSTGSSIVCFGDSITFGYGVERADSYPTALSKMVKVLVINAGIDGDTTSEALKRVQSDVLSRDPFLVIIEFGGNDFLRKVPLSVTVDNISSMVRMIQGRGVMVAIADSSAGLFLAEYRAACAKIARETGSIFVPEILAGIITNPSMKSDFLHPNAFGYKMIALRVLKSIGPYVTNALVRTSVKK